MLKLSYNEIGDFTPLNYVLQTGSAPIIAISIYVFIEVLLMHLRPVSSVRRILGRFVSVLALTIACMFYGLLLNIKPTFSFEMYLFFDSYALISQLSITVCMFIIMNGLFVPYITHQGIIKNLKPEHIIISALFLLFLLMLPIASNLFIVLLSIVGFSIALYVLILIGAEERGSREAGVKYFILSSLSSVFLAGAIAFIYILGKTLTFSYLSLYSATHLLTGAELQLGSVYLSFLLIAIAFKISTFPVHFWTPEVYEGSPFPITGLFILPLKVGVLLFLFRFLGSVFQGWAELWAPLLFFMAFGSIVIGCIGALNETRLKRFIAWSSINQIGFALLGLAATLESAQYTLLFVLIYILTSAGFILVTFTISKKRAEWKPITYLTDLQGLGQHKPKIAALLTIFLFSFAGIPPLAGFFSKYYILLITFKTQGPIALLILLTSVVSAYYYLRIIKIIWFDKDVTGIKYDFYTHINEATKLILGLITFFLVFFLICSDPVITTLRGVSMKMFFPFLHF